MNKKMRAIQQAMQDKFAAATAAMEGGDLEKAATLMDEGDTLQKEFDLEARLYAQSKGLVPEDIVPPVDPAAAPSGFAVIAKLLRKEGLTDVEKALVTGTAATHGENNLIPEDVDVTIRELRKSYVSARELVTVIPTAALSGSFVFEENAPAGLITFEDGENVPAGAEPKFATKTFTIKLMGMNIPISNVLTGAEKAGLTAYLNTWFVKNAILSENVDIFAGLKLGKTAKTLSGLDALQTSLNLDLDPSCLLDGVIVTNQTGFNLMDMEKDSDGNNRLEKDPKSSTQRIFKGLPVKVYADAQLPNVEGKAPVFYGATKAGCYYIDFADMMFAASEHAGFLKNLTYLRVIEGYAVIAADGSAHLYGLYSAPTVQAAAFGGPEAPAAPTGDGHTEAELGAMTNPALLALANELGVEGVSASTVKAELVAAILAAQAV